MRFELGGRTQDSARLRLLGEGGEAEVYALGATRALKLFKDPSHASYAGDAAAAAAARARLSEHQEKLPAFPQGLTARLAAPEALATGAGGRILGYAMARIDGAEALFHYGQPAFRRAAAIAPASVVAAMADLHASVTALHRAGVVIGDFNDLNVLVKDEEAWLIDADSFQYGRWLCRMFSTPFVDPLLCAPDAARLAKAHGQDSDWYAYAVMLWRTLLWAHPFGGVHKPKSGKPIPHDKRPLARLSVMSPDIVYPKAAIPFDRLPLDLLDRFARIFERDERGPFPLDAVRSIVWTTCRRCGAEHARASCPSCGNAPAAVAATLVVRGTVTAERVFRSAGVLVDIDLSGASPVVLRRTRTGLERVRLEKGAPVEQTIPGRLEAGMRAFVRSGRTVLARGSALADVPLAGAPRRRSVDMFLGRVPAVAANASRIFWIENGEIMREGALGPDYPERIASAVEGRTMLWAGERRGLAVYLTPGGAGGVLFETDGSAFREVKLPRLGDQVIELEARMGSDMAWLFASVVRGAMRRNLCLAIAPTGEVLATAEAAPEDGSWLGAIGGACAAGAFLLAPTDAGLARVEVKGTQILIVKEFPDTAPFVDAATRLTPGRDGLYAVNHGELVKLTIRAN